MEVDELLGRWLVVPLNSAPHYLLYNGGIERAKRELKGVLRPHLLAVPTAAEAGLVDVTVHDLNHRPRRCLRGHTPCETFGGAKPNRRGHPRRRSKELFDQISEQAMHNLLEPPVDKHRPPPKCGASPRQAAKTGATAYSTTWRASRTAGTRMAGRYLRRTHRPLRRAQMKSSTRMLANASCRYNVLYRSPAK